MIEILYKKRAILLHEQTLGGAISEKIHRRYLVVCDLHIGLEDRLKGEGVSLESNSNQMAQDLVELVTNQNATDLVINGDIKSGTDRISNSEWDNVPKFFSKLSSACKVTAVPGNHDAGLAHLLPKDVEIADMNGFVVGDNLLIHGHTKPLPKFSTCRRIIIGHLHPTYNEKGNPLSGMPVWLMCKIRREKIFGGMIQILNSNKSKQGFDDLMEVVVMPSFNRDLGLLGFWRDATSEERRSAPLLRDLKNSDSAVVITLDGEIIGDETLLPRVL